MTTNAKTTLLDHLYDEAYPLALLAVEVNTLILERDKYKQAYEHTKDQCLILQERIVELKNERQS